MKGWSNAFGLKQYNYTLTCCKMALFWVHARPHEPLFNPQAALANTDALEWRKKETEG